MVEKLYFDFKFQMLVFSQATDMLRKLSPLLPMGNKQQGTSAPNQPCHLEGKKNLPLRFYLGL